MLPPLATALDIETGLTTVSRPVAQLVSVAVAGGLGRDLVPAHHRERVLVLFRDCLAAGLIAQNAPYDLLTGLVWSGGELLPDIIEAYEAGRVYDTMTRQKLLDIATGGRQRRKYNLGAIGARYGLDIDKDDPWRLRFAELLGLEIEQWPAGPRAYAMGDVDGTHAIAVAQDAAACEIEDELGLQPGQIFGTAEIHARAHIALYQQTVIGLRTDPAAVAALVRRVSADITELGEQVVRAGFARWGGTKRAPRLVASQKATAAAIEQYCDEHDLPVPRTDPSTKFPAGQVSLSEDALIKLGIPKGHPLDALRRWKGRRTLAAQRIPALQRPTWRTRYDECKDTARTGASGPQGKRSAEWWADPATAHEWTGGNGQNWPQKEKGWRECIVPAPGHVFVISDFGGQELVAWAQIQLHLFGSSRLAEVLADPTRDVHRETAARIYGKPESEITKDERKIGKPTMFGFMGGLGARRAVEYYAKDPYLLTISEDDARGYKQAWLETWDEAGPYLDWIARQEGYDGRITMAHPITGFVRGGMYYTEAANFPFQHLAAMGAKASLWELWKAQFRPGPLKGCPQVLFVHDEHVTQCTPDRAAEVLAAQEAIMIEAFAEVCPDVPIRVESHIAERYTKD